MDVDGCIMVLFLIDNMGSGDFFFMLLLYYYCDVDTKFSRMNGSILFNSAIPTIATTTSSLSITSYLAASSNAAETDQTIRGKALLGNL